MKRVIVLCVVVLLAGCSLRSISNAGYPGRYSAGNPLYRGELSELRVLGLDKTREITEQDIQAAAVEKRERLTLKKGDSIVLVQSGALLPDHEMIAGFDRYFTVVPVSGVPESDAQNGADYAKSLRYAAAKAGAEKIIVYWGLLEAESDGLATKAVSWVPLAGWMVPDESQRMRIRLKLALIDVRTGQWEAYTPLVQDDKQISATFNRQRADQRQVARLKALAYQSVADSAVARYVR